MHIKCVERAKNIQRVHELEEENHFVSPSEMMCCCLNRLHQLHIQWIRSIHWIHRIQYMKPRDRIDSVDLLNPIDPMDPVDPMVPQEHQTCHVSGSAALLDIQ